MALRILMLGSPKSGKTSTMAAAANAGWTVRYCDFDGNIDPLVAHTNPDKRGNIQRVDCLDSLGIKREVDKRSGNPTGHISYGFNAENPPRAWKAMTDAMDKWPVDGSDPRKWDPRTNVLVIDSLTTASQARMRLVRHVSGRGFGERNFRDYMLAQEDIENFLVALKVYVPCPVVVMAHIQQMSTDLDIELEDSIPKEKRGMLQAMLLEEKLKEAAKAPPILGPVSVGKAQIKTIAAHFNGAVLVEARPSTDRRVMRVKPIEGLNLGLPFSHLGEKAMPGELEIENAMGLILKEWVSILPKDSSSGAEKGA